MQTIYFVRARQMVEVLTKYLKDRNRTRGFDPETICAYRGGYLPKLRREIERGLRSGEIHEVVSTNALELGVDIGSLDVAVLTGYPGTLASTLQQAGRAGRRGGMSLAVLVCRSTALDQYIAAHPEYVFERPEERAVTDPDNLIVFVSHLKCAAFELPFDEGELFGEMSFLEEAGASASVVADDEVEVDVIPGEHVRRLLDSLPGFAARFYHSLAVTLSERLRRTSRTALPPMSWG